MSTLLNELLTGALDLVFSPSCVACRGPIATGLEDRFVCRLCWARSRPLPLPRCPRCWTPLPNPQVGIAPSCRVCPDLRPALRTIRSAFLMEGPVRGLVHALKYQGWSSLAGPMAARMAAADWPREVSEEVRRIVPVPSTAARLRERGYNQAALLAAEVGARNGWQVEPSLLARTHSTGSQTTLHPGERRANVAGAFRVPAAAAKLLASEHLLLIDDVWTTGATAFACTDALLDAGARAVSVLTFARALPELESQSRRLEAANF